MPEFRQNVATKEWVIIATERARRPEDFVGKSRVLTHTKPQHVANCPFCPGNEKLTPEPFLVTSGADGKWKIRVIPNKFAALSSTATDERRNTQLAKRMDGFGFHDVIVESPLHNSTLALAEPVDVGAVLQSFNGRAAQVVKDTRIQQIIMFKNHGESAGTSLEHPHCQMISLPIVPNNIRTRLEEAMRYYDDHGACVYCDIISNEPDFEKRVIMRNEKFVAFIPFAAFSPFHTWIVPHVHRPLFTQIDEGELAALAQILKQTLQKLYVGLNDPDYNISIRMAPLTYDRIPWFHWYLSIVPRLTKTAGFEMGSGMYINSALPESSAAFLRGVRTP